MTTGEDVVLEIRKTLRILALSTALLYLFVIGVLIFAWMEAAKTHAALCTFRSDLSTRLASTEKLLNDHPKADPVLVYGLRIPRATLVANAGNQRKGVDSLRNLDC